MLIMSMSSEIMTHVPPSYVEGRSQKMAFKLLEQKSIFYIEHEVRDPPERSAVRHCHFLPFRTHKSCGGGAEPPTL